MEIKRIEKIRNEEKEQRQVSQTCENIREAELRWLGHVERNVEGVVMRTWETEVGEHRQIGRPTLRWSDGISKDTKEK